MHLALSAFLASAAAAFDLVQAFSFTPVQRNGYWFISPVTHAHAACLLSIPTSSKRSQHCSLPVAIPTAIGDEELWPDRWLS